MISYNDLPFRTVAFLFPRNEQMSRVDFTVVPSLVGGT